MNNENIYTPTHLSQATTAIWMSANGDARNHAVDVENSVVCGNAVEQNRGDAVERATRGESGRDSKCRFPNTGGLHGTSGDAPLETHLKMACGNAVEQKRNNTVEQATRGKSRCESKCCFPNTVEDFTAHLEMHPLRHIQRWHVVMPLSKTPVTPLSEP